MKNLQKGFIVPVLLVIIALLVVGGGVYVYESKKTEVPPVVDNGTQQTNTQTPPVNTQTNNPPSQIDNSFKVLSPKAGDSWKIGGVYSVKFQNLPKGSFVQGWLQDKSGASTGSASIGVIDTGRDGNPSSNIQITVPSQWCGGECGAVEYVTPGQYRLLLRIYPSVNNSSYQTFYSDYFTLTSNQTATPSTKSYVNTQYGFSLQYPSSVSVTLVNHVPPHGTDLILPCDGSQGTYNYSTCGAKGSGNGLEKDGAVGDVISFWISQMPMTNLEAYARNYQGGEFTKINVNGREAYQLHFGSTPDGVTHVYMQNSGHVFIFRYTDANTQAAKAILATVQLTQ